MTKYQWGQAALITVATVMLFWMPLEYSFRAVLRRGADWLRGRAAWKPVKDSRGSETTRRVNIEDLGIDPDWRD